jgi:RNA polymerase sigma factor (sigma-70 family)
MSRAAELDAEFGALFLQEFPRLARTVHHIVGDRARAEELAQDAFVELFRHWRTVAEYDRPDLWLRRVAIRKAQRERHRGWRRRELEVLAAPPTTVDAPPTPRPEVLEAVRRLAPGQRAVVVLFYFEDRPMPEIADILDIKESTGWSQLHTARKHLAAALAEGLEGEVSDAIG